ncbi:MAG: hypothetical protein NC933_05805 [Candidatus Omnitrophica bacterium]|nr:hypothetical protein [Candidatus Omnitrophota bacterium]
MRHRYNFIVIILILAASLTATIPAQAIDMSSKARQAQEYYEKGEYDKAAKIYESLVESGIKSGPLYYNLGNCYLQKGDSLGKAIFCYEAARFMIPRDTALLINLRYAKSLMKQADVAADKHFLLALLRMAFDLFTLEKSFALINTCYFGCAIFFVLSLFVRRFKLFLRWMAALLLVVSVLMIVPLHAKIVRAERTGIVIAPAVDAKLEPFTEAASKFPLYEGMELNVLKTTKEWHKVRRGDGKVGWLRREALWRL